MYNTIFEMLDVKPCSLTCAEGPFVIVIDCITPNCTVSSLKPITEVLTSTPGFCELVQDCIGDALEGFDYADGVNAWIQENPLSTALNISYDNSVSLLTATTVQGAIDEIVAGFCLSVSNCLVDNGLPANLDIFLLNGLQTVVGGTYDYELSSTDNIMSLLLNGSVVDTATIVNSNDLSNTGLVITSDVNGVVDSIDITSDVQALIASNTDSVTNTVTGFRVATHTAVDGTAIDINVPIATITPSTNGYTYTAIDNSTKAIVYDVIDQGTNNPKLTITVDGTLVKTIDLNQNDIQIDNAGSDFDLVDDILTFLETNGDSATISFAKYNVTVTVQPNGDQLIYQNGNLLATVYKNAIDIAYNNTTSGLTATNVQDAIDEVTTAQRPFIKVGNTSETSSTSVLSTDDVFHEGRILLGSSGSPTVDLQVKKANSGATEILVENTNTTASDYSDVVSLNGDVRTTIGAYKSGGYGYTGTESNHDFYIYANNTTAIVVQPNGHVGIGNAVNIPNIDDVLYVDSGTAGDSGITMEQLTSATAPTAGAGAIGVNANGKIVRVAAPVIPVPSVLGDAAGSVSTEITTDTPIIVSTNPAQVGVLTDGTSIIIPKDKSICELDTITQVQADTLGLEDLKVVVCGTGDPTIDGKTVSLDKVSGLFGGPSITAPVMGLAGSTSVSNIGQTTADLTGTYTSDGGSPVTATGFVLYPSGNPSTIIGGSGVLQFPDGTLPSPITSTATGLTTNTNYCFKPYATNSVGTSYGVEVCFMTLPSFAFIGKHTTSNNLIKYDITSNTVIGTYTVTGSEMLDLVRVGQYIYSIHSNGTIAKFDTVSNTTISTVSFITTQGNSIVYGGNGKLYAGGTNQSHIQIIDIATFTITGTIDTAEFTIARLYASGGYLYSVHRGDTSVKKYDLSSNTVVFDAITGLTTSSEVFGIIKTGGGVFAGTLSNTGNTASKINDTGSVLLNINGVNGWHIETDGSNLYWSRPANNSIIKTDENLSILTNISTPSEPHKIKYDGQYIWSPNQGAGNLTKYSTAGTLISTSISIPGARLIEFL